jgi:hypothetical protein
MTGLVVLLLVVVVIVCVVAWIVYCAADSEVEFLKGKCNGLIAERDEARHRATEYEADAADLQKQLADMKAKYRAADAERDARQADLTELTAELVAITAKWTK